MYFQQQVPRFQCDTCNIQFLHQSHYESHIKSKQHLKNQVCCDYQCSLCHQFFGNNKNNYDVHTKSAKHLKNVNQQLLTEQQYSNNYQCQPCNQMFGNNKANYEQHLLSAKEKSTAITFTCTYGTTTTAAQ
jgi:hypothetical protein